MAFRPCDDSPSLENAIRRRELYYLYSERKLSRYGNENEYYLPRLPPIESSHHIGLPYWDERFAFPRRSQFHPYYNPVKFPLPKGLTVPPYQPYRNGLLNFRRDRFTNENFSHSKNVFRRYKRKLNRNRMKAEMLPFKDDFSNQTLKREENVAESESSIVNYCLDGDTQYIISRLQNDFRLTKKYKTFVMHEMPLIADFKPTPATTAYKFHNRFKCLFQQFLDVNDLNVDLESELEKATEEKSVLENVSEQQNNI